MSSWMAAAGAIALAATWSVLSMLCGSSQISPGSSTTTCVRQVNELALAYLTAAVVSAVLLYFGWRIAALALGMLLTILGGALFVSVYVYGVIVGLLIVVAAMLRPEWGTSEREAPARAVEE